MSFSRPFFRPSMPFHNGGLTAIQAPPTAVGLAGIQYLIDLPKYRYQGLPGLREQSAVQGGEPSDTMMNVEGAWWRYRISFHHGAGQPVVDLDQDVADRFRYDSSRGIDPFEKYRACLLHRTEKVLDVAADDIYMTTTGTHVYVSDGAGVKRSADLTTWVPITGLTGTVTGMTSDGTNVYICTTTDIYSVGTGPGASDFTTAVPTTGYSNIAFCANRLIAGDGNRVVEVGTTSLTTIYTHFQPAFRWTTIFNVGSRIYLGGYAGNRSELYSATTTDVGALVLAAEAASFFTGELLRNALSYGGSVILATSKGVRFASLGQDGSLQYGPLIDAPGDTRALCAEGRFAWFGWQTFPDSGSGLGRLALDTFVDTLLPAYSSDIFNDDINDDIMSAARFGARTLFAVKGEGVYASHQTEYVTEGYIEIGELYFGTVEDKSITETLARVEQLEDGESVAIEIFDAEGHELLASSTIAELGATEVAANADGDRVNRMSGRITLRGDGSSEPCLRHWRARGYPIAPSTEEWLVPLILHSRVVLGDGEGEVISYDPWDEVERLRRYWRSREVIIYQEGQHAFRVRIDNLQVEPAKWRDGGDWFELTCTVRLLSV